MKRLFYLISAAILVCFVAGCATIVSKSNYPITISTDPDKASISIVDEHDMTIYAGKSPAALKLKAGRGYFARSYYKIKISQPGYETQVIPVEFKLNGWYFGNLLFGGLLGMLVVDPLTGAMWKIKQDFYVVNLQKTGNSQETALQIKMLPDVTPAEKAAMERIR